MLNVLATLVSINLDIRRKHENPVAALANDLHPDILCLASFGLSRGVEWSGAGMSC